MPHPTDIHAIPAFTAEEYQRLRLAVADPHNLPADHDAFRELQDKLEQTYRRSGALTARVEIKLDALRQYVGDDDAGLDAAACFHYAQAVASRLRDNR